MPVFITVLTSNSLSRRSMVQILRTSTSKSAPNVHFFAEFPLRHSVVRILSASWGGADRPPAQLLDSKTGRVMEQTGNCKCAFAARKLSRTYLKMEKNRMSKNRDFSARRKIYWKFNLSRGHQRLSNMIWNFEHAFENYSGLKSISWPWSLTEVSWFEGWWRRTSCVRRSKRRPVSLTRLEIQICSLDRISICKRILFMFQALGWPFPGKGPWCSGEGNHCGHQTIADFHSEELQELLRSWSIGGWSGSRALGFAARAKPPSLQVSWWESGRLLGLMTTPQHFQLL